VLCVRTLCVRNIFFFSSRRRHTRSYGDWSSDVCSSDLIPDDSAWRLLPWSVLGGPQLARDAARTNDDVYDQAIRACVAPIRLARSEERRVGKECRTRWSPEQ